MGGRASEELFLGHENVTTGCSSDLNRATSIGYSYVRELGMLDGVNLINSNKRDLSDEYNYKIDMEVQRILRVLGGKSKIIRPVSRSARKFCGRIRNW